MNELYGKKVVWLRVNCATIANSKDKDTENGIRAWNFTNER